MSGTGPEPIGGQALIEGVMMRRGSRWAAAVRQPDGTIVTTSHRLPAGLEGPRRVPLVRGVLALGESVGLGTRAMAWAARAREPEDDRRLLQGRRRPLHRRRRGAGRRRVRGGSRHRRQGGGDRRSLRLQPGGGAHQAVPAPRLPVGAVAGTGGAAGVRLPRRRAHDDPRLRARRAARARAHPDLRSPPPALRHELPADRGGRVDRRARGHRNPGLAAC